MLAVLIVLLGLSGCTASRALQFGLLPNSEPLVTLIVTEDLDEVKRECAEVPATGQVLGCHISRSLTLPGYAPTLGIKIVRYTDSLPSAMAVEIEAHELCHAAAALQHISDPCHQGNGGMLQAGTPARTSAIRR